MSTKSTIRSFCGVVALAAMGLTVPPAQAGSVDTLSCIRSASFFTCVRQWDRPVAGRIGPPDPREQAEADERERKWLARCRPQIRQDGYGVGRYHYAAAGCEYGRSED